jgi:hypothetical protein
MAGMTSADDKPELILNSNNLFESGDLNRRRLKFPPSPLNWVNPSLLTWLAGRG